nr:beta-1,3-galactosyltransferase 5-like [Lytechinus pictus]
MPVHLNMSPILLRVLRIIFMKLLGTTSVLVATGFSISLLLLLAVIDSQIFQENRLRTSIDLDSGHGISRTLPTLNDRSSVKGRHKLEWEQDQDTADQFMKPEWDVQKLADVFTAGPDCTVKPLLLLIVTSAPENIKRRTAIRHTWARYRDPKVLNTTHFKTIFLIGKTSSLLNEQIEDESEKHKDILIGDYVDSYRNLTYKVQHGIMWSADSCQSQYLLKTDDDCFVNTKGLVEFLTRHNHQTKNLYVGHKMRSREVVRDPASKWYVSWKDYPRDSYPWYASGTGYLLSSDVVHKIAKRTSYHHPFPVEDAYMGVLAEDLGVGLVDTPRFALFSTKWTMCNYLYFFVVHDLTPEQQYVCLRYADESEKTCQRTKDLELWD